MSVITNSLLLVRRIGELQRRRQSLLERQEQAQQHLPEWALEPLRLVGMAADEIRGLVADLSRDESEAGIDELESQLDAIEREIEALEGQLVATEATSIDGVEAILALAVTRLRGFTVTDPGDVFYDHGEARVLAMLERALDDLRALLRRESRAVG